MYMHVYNYCSVYSAFPSLFLSWPMLLQHRAVMGCCTQVITIQLVQLKTQTCMLGRKVDTWLVLDLATGKKLYELSTDGLLSCPTTEYPGQVLHVARTGKQQHSYCYYGHQLSSLHRHCL